LLDAAQMLQQGNLIGPCTANETPGKAQPQILAVTLCFLFTTISALQFFTPCYRRLEPFFSHISDMAHAKDNEELIDYEDEHDVAVSNGATISATNAAGAAGEGERGERNFSGIHSTGFRYILVIFSSRSTPIIV
jgi:hypothetical protein